MRDLQSKNILKRQVSFSFALIFLIAFATLVGLLILLSLSHPKPESFGENIIASYHISYLNPLLDAGTSNYTFNDINKFKTTKTTNYFPNCGSVSYPSSEVNFTEYSTKQKKILL